MTMRLGIAIAMLPSALAACTSGDGRLALSDAAYSADVEGNDASTLACSGPQDCIAHIPTGPAIFCCIDKACIYGQAAQAVPCSDAEVQLIQASNYDQSCTTDSDCVAVGQGNFCLAGAGNCPTAAIRKSAYARYQADVAKTQAAVCSALSSCTASFGPCCRHGTCQMNLNCESPSDTLPACADAGGSCGPFITQCGDKGTGPPDSCAYSDEMCCLN